MDASLVRRAELLQIWTWVISFRKVNTDDILSVLLHMVEVSFFCIL
jgi:hypothetical protein